MKNCRIPSSPYEVPNQAGDLPWQWAYTLLCFVLALAAIAVTYLIEKPAQRRILARGKKGEPR